MNEPFPPLPLDPVALGAVQQRLLGWFATHGRDLPWRHTRDPYRILVSEIMLQQTQVDRVLPKYRAFLALFPTLEALAAAPTAEVIRLWAGLGYNRRAVNLQRTARVVLEEHGGAFPRDVAALRGLPGVGPYTAGAIACFAFEQDVAFMDTNIRRVLRRWLAGPDDAGPALGDRALAALAEAVIPPGRGWSWNQAIMELGALICTAATPACWRCPLREGCRAYTALRQADEHLFGAVEAQGDAYAAPVPRGLRRAAERREPPYAGSNRDYRGRLIDMLRALPHGEACTLNDLGPQLKAGYSAEDGPWLRDLAVGLERDGLVVLEGQTVRLP